MISAKVLELDCAAAIDSVAAALRRIVVEDLRRRGAVVGMSGGIDSSVVAALLVRALGPDRVVGLFMPERDSSPESLALASGLATELGIRTETVDLGPALEELGCYRYRDEAIRTVVPEFGPGWRAKIVLPPLDERARVNVFRVVSQSPTGETRSTRTPPDE